MGRRKIVISDLVFEDNQPVYDNVVKLFDTEYVIKYFNKNNMERFRRVINHKNIQLILHDKALMNTIFAYFSNNLNTSNTSEKTFMHRNTLNYRLDKIKRYTGLNLRLFEHALLFKNLIIIDSIIKDASGEIKIRRTTKSAKKDEIKK